ncbi:hypothetical protein [Methanofollis sp. W23]|uniref:hypothetical protein n=1 Tax=Methanofollis sp. W23 TaxID=2817849 RepID=UPI001AE79C2D|nr:hypothetical protein [Methanofollis sp. W23]
MICIVAIVAFFDLGGVLPAGITLIVGSLVGVLLLMIGVLLLGEIRDEIVARE